MIREAHFHRRNLPHIYLPEAAYFITYRLKGSLPVHIIKELKCIIDRNSKIKNKDEQYKLQKKFFGKYDKLLDAATYGPKFLNENTIAGIVKESLFYYEKKEYRLICFCIMPNHVHIVFILNEKSKQLDKLMKIIKGYSSREINKILNSEGSNWQSESYDHIIRDEEELFKIVNYVIYNPVKAKLVDKWEDWTDTYLCEEFK